MHKVKLLFSSLQIISSEAERFQYSALEALQYSGCDECAQHKCAHSRYKHGR